METTCQRCRTPLVFDGIEEESETVRIICPKCFVYGTCYIVIFKELMKHKPEHLQLTFSREDLFEDMEELTAWILENQEVAETIRAFESGI